MTYLPNIHTDWEPRDAAELPDHIKLRTLPCPRCGGGRWPQCERCESSGWVVRVEGVDE